MVVLQERSIILLAGIEQFLKEQNLRKLKSTFLNKESQDFNFSIFYAAITPAEKILECAYTLPFLGQRRVILVRQIEDFSASERELILTYVKKPSPHTLLILETTETDLTQNFFGEICQNARLIFCNPLKDRHLFAWIDDFVRQRNKRIEEQAKKLLVNNLGGDLKLLANSLDNIILYIGANETIGFSDVEEMTKIDVEGDVFELFDATIDGDKKKVFQILDNLLKDGVSSSQILGALLHKIKSESNRMDMARVEEALEDLQNTDVNIKTGKQNPRIALELLMVKLLNLI